MKKYSKYILSIVLLLNVILAGYFLLNQFFLRKSRNLSLPNSVITENETIKNLFTFLREKSANEQIGVVLLSSETTLCSQYSIVDLIKDTKLNDPKLKFYILFPSKIGDQEISNFKSNLNLENEILRMNSDLNKHWEDIQNKYKIPATVMVSNHGKIYTSQDIPELKGIIKSFAD
jgi:hypothetical protein